MSTTNDYPSSSGPDYWHQSRRLSTGILLILPLAAAYQLGIVQGGSPVRNLAELWMSRFISTVGVPAAHVVNGLLIGGCVMAVVKLRREGPLVWWFLLVMVLESFVYAAAMLRGLGAAASAARDGLAPLLYIGGGGWRSMLVAVGAGVYEELLFRLLLLGGGAALLHHLFRWKRGLCLGLTLIVSSALFSLAHYLGALGEAPRLYTFLYRGMAGLVLGTVYIFRGVGIAACTHSTFNLLALLAR